MQDLLAHPAFQSAVAPLLCGLVVALILRRFGVMWQGLAIVTGLFVAVWLTIGLNFQPLTSTRKIILASMVLPFASFLLVRASLPVRYQAVTLAVIAALVVLWVIWPVLGRQEGLEVWMTGGKVAVYTALVTGLLAWFSRDDMAREGGALLALGIGTGASAFIAASALYGQLAFAVTAALGGLLLVLLVLPGKGGINTGIGSFAVFAAAIPLAVIGGASTVYAKMPGMALVFLVMIPVFAAIPLDKKLNVQNLWIRGSLAAVLGFLPAIPAIWLALDASEPMMGY
ncbi:hypothetical protein [Kaarinaea lacus]